MKLAVVVLPFLAVYGPLLPGLARDWSSHPILSHGYAIPFIAAFFAWSKRAHLRTLPRHPARAGLVVLVSGLALSVVGQAGGEPFVTRLSLIVSLLGVLWSLTGWPFTRALLFPVGYLLFMIPPPFAVVKTAMAESRLFDATLATTMLRTVGVPVYREGNLLHLPNTILEVADPCSSVLTVVALSALAGAYAYLTQSSALVRTVLVLSTLPLAIAANISRIVILATGVYRFGPVMAAYITEQTYGIINFVLFFALLVVFERLLNAVWRPAPAMSDA